MSDAVDEAVAAALDAISAEGCNCPGDAGVILLGEHVCLPGRCENAIVKLVQHAKTLYAAAPASAPSELLAASESRSGVALILIERRRQIDKEGWSAEHDAKHGAGEMAVAAACYANPQPPDKFGVPAGWPWHKSWWKPKDRIRDLVRAGALIAAEIDRLALLDGSDSATFKLVRVAEEKGNG